MRRIARRLPWLIFLVAMFAGSGLIAANSLVYFDFGAVAPFVVERLPERFASIWLAALRVHVAAALVSLPLCLALTFRWLQRRPAWHRWIGRGAGVIVLFALVPSGVVLALHAKGGPSVTLGFVLSAAIVGIAMVHGVLAARRRELRGHQRAMRHVVAQMSVAVTSRALLRGFDAFGVDPDLAYVVALWAPVLGGAAAGVAPRSAGAQHEQQGRERTHGFEDTAGAASPARRRHPGPRPTRPHRGSPARRGTPSARTSL